MHVTINSSTCILAVANLQYMVVRKIHLVRKLQFGIDSQIASKLDTHMLKQNKHSRKTVISHQQNGQTTCQEEI